MSQPRRLEFSAGAGFIAAAATIGAATAGHAATPNASSNTAAHVNIARTVSVGHTNASGAYLKIDPLITVQSFTISVGALLSGKVYSKNSATAEADLGSYQVIIDGKQVGGADPGDLQCATSDPLVAVQVRRNPIATRVNPGQHRVTISESFCGDTGASLTSTVSRTVNIGTGPSQPPTPSPTITHLGVTG